MNNHTKEFLTKLSDLLEEYKASLEIEGDSYSGGPIQITLEVLNPKTFDEAYDQWIKDHPHEKYPFGENLYSYAEWVDLGTHCGAETITKLIEVGCK